MRKFYDRPEEKWAFIRREDRKNKRLAVFIHGFYGNYLSTWGKIPDLIVDNADNDPATKDWDYVFLGYETRNVETYLDIAHIISTQCKHACLGNRPFGSKYDELVLIGHSLGTLGIRQLLCAWSIHEPANLIGKIKNVILFGTPINGSGLANLAFWSKVANALKPANPQLRMLKTWTETAHGKHPWPLVRVVLGLEDMVVGHRYIDLIQYAGDAEHDLSNLDHGQLVKPGNWNNSAAIDYIKTALS